MAEKTEAFNRIAFLEYENKKLQEEKEQHARSKLDDLKHAMELSASGLHKKMDHVSAEVHKVTTIIMGGNEPEKGLAFRTALLEDSARTRNKVLMWFGAGMSAVIGERAWQWISGRH